MDSLELTNQGLRKIGRERITEINPGKFMKKRRKNTDFSVINHDVVTNCTDTATFKEAFRYTEHAFSRLCVCVQHFEVKKQCLPK